jgi:hypothetical protein
MTVIPIKSPTAKATRKSVSADFADNACAQGLTVCRAHLLIIASHLLETGRGAEARVLSDAAAMVQGVERDVTPPSPQRSAPEAWEGRP